MSYSENFKSLFDTYYTRLQENNYLGLPVMKFNGVKIKIKIYGSMLLQDNSNKNSIPFDTYNSYNESHKTFDRCIYRLNIRGELTETEIKKYGIPLYDSEYENIVYEHNKYFTIDIPFKQVVKLSKSDIFNKIPKIKDFINETLDDFAVELPSLEFNNYHFKLHSSSNEDDDILNYTKEHELFWKKIQNPEYECACCICTIESRFKTECGHTLCLGCHYKLKVENEDDGDEPALRKCPMCRNEYSDMNWDEEH